MSSNISYPATEFSSSDLTVQSERSDAILALGKKIVTEQGFDGSVDTLGRWMAHHIAELIQAAESAGVDERPAKMANVREAVLALWAHRHVLPSGRNPFEGMEPIFQALESLNPDTHHYRYFSPSHAPSEDDEESEEVKTCVEIAVAVDRAAKVIVDFCLAQAAQKSLDASKDWVTLARAAEVDAGQDITLIRIIAARSDSLKEPNPVADRRRILNDRKHKLEVLLSGAAGLLGELEAQLGELPPEAEDDQSGCEIFF